MRFLERRPWALPALAFLASRAVTAIGFWRGTASPSAGRLVHVAAGRYDARWYSMITAHGYAADPHAPAFYPAYPLLARAVLGLVANLDVALVLTANLAAAAAAVILYRVYAPRWGPVPASLGAALLLCAPDGIFLGLGFSEAVFLAFAGAAFLAALRRHWVLAGCLAGAACLVRSNGVLLAAPLLVIAWREGAWRHPAAILAGGAGLVVGAAAYPAYLALRFGDPLLYAHLQASAWHHHLVNPLRPVGAGVARMLRATWTLLTLRSGSVRLPDGPAVLTDGAMLVTALAALVAGWSRLERWEWLWVLLVLLPPLLVFEVPDSIGRYLLAAFPIYFLGGRLLERWPAAAMALMAVGLAFQGELAFRLAQGYFVA